MGRDIISKLKIKLNDDIKYSINDIDMISGDKELEDINKKIILSMKRLYIFLTCHVDKHMRLDELITIFHTLANSTFLNKLSNKCLNYIILCYTLVYINIVHNLKANVNNIAIAEEKKKIVFFFHKILIEKNNIDVKWNVSCNLINLYLLFNHSKIDRTMPENAKFDLNCQIFEDIWNSCKEKLGILYCFKF